MKLKDTTFDIHGSTWNIKFVEEIKEGDSYTKGDCDPIKYEIRIAKTVRGIKPSQKELQKTLLHELVHAIFITGAYHSCYEDEPLVEHTTRCLNSMINNKII